MLAHRPRILFYYHHFGGLGHGTRIAAICQALKEINFCEIAVINSGRKQPELGIENHARVINLPFFEADHGLFSGLKANEGLELTFRKRSAILKKVREKFKPDVAVFEHFPFGRNSLAQEISSFIGFLKDDGCRIYSSVRDIIDQSVDVEGLLGHLKLFDGVLVHSDKEMGFVTSFKQPEELKEKIFFTGRVALRKKMDLASKTEIRKPFDLAGRKWIVISVGGGIDGERIICRLIGIKKLLDKRVDSSFLIFTGPHISPGKYSELKKKVRGCKDIIMTRFDADYLRYVDAADLSISMGGYNSINNALLTPTRTMIFPRLSDGEQGKRAQYFSEYVDLADESLPDEKLVEKILGCMHKPRTVYPMEMRGAQATARLIAVACDLECIKIRVNSKCNLACDMCSWKRESIALPEAAFRSLILRSRIIGVRVINVTGGEPTLLPDLKDILKYIKDNGFRVSLSTNGYVGPERLKEIVPLVDMVDISLDSYDADIHDRIRGKTGAFKKTMGTIGLLAASNLRPHINVTIRPDNYRGLHRMIVLLAGNIDSISFNLVDVGMDKTSKFVLSEEQLRDFYFNEVILILKECMKNKIKVQILPFFQELIGRRESQVLLALLSRKEEYALRFRTIFHPNNNKCGTPKVFVRINPSGDVAFCCFQDQDGNPWGNVIEQDLCDIVVSDTYFNFINNAIEGKGPCRTCKKGYNANYGGDH
jgi:predicted glycosyltransferase/MoaA/NifB/PqqE/SkfB family radical SAM enzyme